MNPLDLVRLTALMGQTQGRPEIVIGLIDGPVALDHPDLAAGRIRAVPGRLDGACARSSRRTSVVPPLLDAWSADQTLLSTETRRRLS